VAGCYIFVTFTFPLHTLYVFLHFAFGLRLLPRLLVCRWFTGLIFVVYTRLLLDGRGRRWLTNCPKPTPFGNDAYPLDQWKLDLDPGITFPPITCY